MSKQNAKIASQIKILYQGIWEGEHVTIAEIPLALISVDQNYQRGISKSLVEKIANKFTIERYTLPRIFLRTDGTYWCVDGQTTIGGLILKKALTAIVLLFDSQGPEHEAETFRGVNQDRRNPKLADIFKASLLYDLPTQEIQAFLDKFGFKAGYNPGKWPYIRAYSVPYDAQSNGVLNDLLHVIREVWLGQTEMLGEKTMGGIQYFLTHVDNYELKRCISKWKKITPKELIDAARTLKQYGSAANMQQAFAIVLVTKYNSGLTPTSNKRITLV